MDNNQVEYDTKKSGLQYKGKKGTNIYLNKKQLYDMRFKCKAGMWQNKFEDTVIRLVRKLKPKGRYMIIQRYERAGWREGRFNQGTKKIDIFDPREWYLDERVKFGRIREFSIIIQQETKKRGGYGEHNDCLWICLLKAYGEAERIPTYNKPWKLKKALRLQRNETVPVSLIPELEDKIRLKINVLGDDVYTSVKEYTQSITIKLVNGHYTLRGDNKELLKGQAYTEKPILIIHVDNEKGIINTYDGTDYGTMTTDMFIEYRSKPITAPYIMVRTEEEDMAEYYKTLTEDADELIDITNGKINLYTCGKDKLASLKLFHNTSRTIHCEKILQDEALWLDKAMMGGIIYGDKKNIDDGYSYDVNSMYPYMMTQLQFPTRRGEFLKLKELKEIVEYGIYHIKIYPNNDTNTKKLFRFNPTNYYTHIDIKRARDLHLKMELFQDNNANCLRYITGRLSGERIFGGFVDYMYKLKVKYSNTSIKNRIKSIMNKLWGALCEREIITKKADKPLYLENVDIQGVIPYGDIYMCEYAENEKIFRTNYARIGCFLTAGARTNISKRIEPIKDRVYRIHTDGFITDGNCNFELNADLGGIKNDHQGKCVVKNSMDVNWT